MCKASRCARRQSGPIRTADPFCTADSLGTADPLCTQNPTGYGRQPFAQLDTGSPAALANLCGRIVMLIGPSRDHLALV